jgi:hypothetical protein
MTNVQDRLLSLDRHPVTLREYRIPTPTLEAFYLLIVRSLRFKIHGSIVYGRSSSLSDLSSTDSPISRSGMNSGVSG